VEFDKRIRKNKWRNVRNNMWSSKKRKMEECEKE
jgi:hypothetical protein